MSSRKSDPSNNFASRGGLKLEPVLDQFKVSVDNKLAADFGASTGGFVDVLLARGAKHVYAVEKGYGVLDWRLRNDNRVTVLERTDALSAQLPEKIDVITIDIGFIRQRDILPVALSFLKPNGQIISLLKPQYEASGHELDKGRLTDAVGQSIVARVTKELSLAGINLKQVLASPVKGSKARVQEYFLLVTL